MTGRILRFAVVTIAVALIYIAIVYAVTAAIGAPA